MTASHPIILSVLLCLPTLLFAQQPMVHVGAAKVDVTPSHPVLLAGYGSRTTEHEGVDTKIWARALAIGTEDPAVLVVLDNCGVPAAIRAAVAQRLAARGVKSEKLVVAATHTHNAPTLDGYAPIVWAGRTSESQEQRVKKYSAEVIDKMEQAVVQALQAREPTHLSWAQGRVTFGGNRRVLRDGQWAGFGFQRDGPVDHSLPVMVARDAAGRVRVVWTNYACHCTTVGSRNQIGGDWAGFANDAIEAEYPDSTALVSIGCGADVGPQPTGSLALAAQHGQAIAKEVARVVQGDMQPLRAGPTVKTSHGTLPLEEPPPRTHWQRQIRGQGFHQQLAQRMLTTLRNKGDIPRRVDYPIQAWMFGDNLALVFLPGEVVVDYSVRLKRELNWEKLWLNGWANDMPGYIPSRRVLQEGGYEAEFSQVYYGQPCRYSPHVEDQLVKAVAELLGPRFSAPPDQKPATFHRAPTGDEAMLRRLADQWSLPSGPSDIAGQQRGWNPRLKRHLRQCLGNASPAVESFTARQGETSQWHNYAGDFSERRFIRQTKVGEIVEWKTPAIGKQASAIVCFSGGLGWESEPSTDGFMLSVEGRDQMRFDVTRSLSRWTAADGDGELLYLPTWSSNVDSAGFFFLKLPRQAAPEDMERSVTIAVRSLGANSKRWFAVDVEQDVARLLQGMRETIHEVEAAGAK